MAQIQSNRDDNTLKSVRDQRTWENLEELAKKKLGSTSNEFKCDCASCSNSEVVRKKIFTKNVSNRSGVLSRSRKNNKFTTTTQSRRKFCAGYDNSYKNVAYTSLCDKPRVLERSVKTKNTIKNLDTTKVRSVEVIKSFPKSCCSALNRKPKNLLAKKSDKSKLPRGRKYLELNSSSLSSPVDESGSVTSNISSTDDETNNQRIKRKEKKSEEFRNCNSSENDFKHLNEQTYQRAARGNRSQEVSYKREGLSPSDFENRETTHKVKNYPTERFLHESPYKNPTVNRILKNQETEGLVTCICDRTRDNDNCTIISSCPVSSIYQDYVKTGSQPGTYRQEYEKSSSSFKDDDYGKEEELIIPTKRSDDSSFDKSHSPNVKLENKYSHWQKFEQNMENISQKYRETLSGLKEMRREVAENEIPKSKEFERETRTREYPIRKFLFETQTVGDDLDSVKNINKSLKGNIIDTSYSTPPQSSRKMTSTSFDREKSPLSGQEKIDPIDHVINLTDKFTINNNITVPSQLGTSLENCQFESCKCDLLEDSKESTGKSTSPLVKKCSVPKEPSKERIKRHDFSLPKIVIPESSERSDIRKMFVYPSEENREPPLTVYRTSSFVKCEIRENKNIGFRYVLTYVQKYVSPTWKPDEQNKSKATSQEHVKTDDYG